MMNKIVYDCPCCSFAITVHYNWNEEDGLKSINTPKQCPLCLKPLDREDVESAVYDNL